MLWNDETSTDRSPCIEEAHRRDRHREIEIPELHLKAQAKCGCSARHREHRRGRIRELSLPTTPLRAGDSSSIAHIKLPPLRVLNLRLRERDSLRALDKDSARPALAKRGARHVRRPQSARNSRLGSTSRQLSACATASMCRPRRSASLSAREREDRRVEPAARRVARTTCRAWKAAPCRVVHRVPADIKSLELARSKSARQIRSNAASQS